MEGMASPYRYRDGLARSGDGYHYRFSQKGTQYQGTINLSRRADAVLWLRRYRDQLANGEVGLATPPSVKLAYEHWLETTKGKASEAHRERAQRAFTLHILPVCGEISANCVDNDVVELIRSRYLEGKQSRPPRKAPKVKKGEAPKPAPPIANRTQQGANTLLAYLRMVIRPLIKRGFLRALPFDVKMLRPQAPVRSFVPAEKVSQFLAAVDRTANAHQSIAIRAMLYLGLRESEALGMRWEWFQGDLETYTPGATKGRESLPLPVHPELRERIRTLKSLSPWLIPAEDGKPHRPQFTVKAILRGGEAIGIKGLTPHRLRTTCATLMARAGIHPFVIQRQLRHKDIKTTLRYVEVGVSDLSTAMSKTWGA